MFAISSSDEFLVAIGYMPYGEILRESFPENELVIAKHPLSIAII